MYREGGKGEHGPGRRGNTRGDPGRGCGSRGKPGGRERWKQGESMGGNTCAGSPVGTAEVQCHFGPRGRRQHDGSHQALREEAQEFKGRVVS